MMMVNARPRVFQSTIALYSYSAACRLLLQSSVLEQARVVWLLQSTTSSPSRHVSQHNHTHRKNVSFYYRWQKDRAENQKQDRLVPYEVSLDRLLALVSAEFGLVLILLEASAHCCHPITSHKEQRENERATFPSIVRSVVVGGRLPCATPLRRLDVSASLQSAQFGGFFDGDTVTSRRSGGCGCCDDDDAAGEQRGGGVQPWQRHSGGHRPRSSAKGESGCAVLFSGNNDFVRQSSQ